MDTVAGPPSSPPSDPGTPPPGSTHRADGTPAPRRRRARVAALTAGAAAVAYVALVDPGAGSSVYPPCPSRTLLGLDCPGCGGLRGTYDLVHGDVVGALDHNLLLPFLLVAVAYGVVLAVAPLFGRHVRPLRPPRWAVVTGAVVLVAFTVLRNLPVAGLEFLGSGTS